jgi:hypothetical protein
MNNYDKAQSMAYDAYQMYSGKPREFAKNAFPMYSYDNPANCFWIGMIEGLLDLGASEAQVEKILRSKHMRWMFDADSEKVVEFGKSFAEQYMVDWVVEQEQSENLFK